MKYRFRSKIILIASSFIFWVGKELLFSWEEIHSAFHMFQTSDLGFLREEAFVRWVAFWFSIRLLRWCVRIPCDNGAYFVRGYRSLVPFSWHREERLIFDCNGHKINLSQRYLWRAHHNNQMSCTASAVSHKSQTIAAKKQFYLYLIFSSSLLGFFLPSHWEFWSYLSVLRPKQLNKVEGEVKKNSPVVSV